MPDDLRKPGTQELLRAMGPPADLAAMRAALETSALKNRVDRARDKSGTTALGIASHFGQLEAMQLLLEHGADADAENLDGATPLSLACFGKHADAAAVLCVFAGEDLDIEEAITDAISSGATEVAAVLHAFCDDEDHPLLARARAMHADSEPALRARAQEAAARLGARVGAAVSAKNKLLRSRTTKSTGASRASGTDTLPKDPAGDAKTNDMEKHMVHPEDGDVAGHLVWRQRAERAEARVRELEARVAELEAAGAGSPSKALSGRTNLSSLADAAARPLEAQFAQFDLDQSGLLSKEELFAILTRDAGGATFTMDDCEKLMTYLDLDGDGKLDISEFCAACVDGALDRPAVLGSQ